jgi:hypothetical protein
MTLSYKYQHYLTQQTAYKIAIANIFFCRLQIYPTLSLTFIEPVWYQKSIASAYIVQRNVSQFTP